MKMFNQKNSHLLSNKLHTERVEVKKTKKKSSMFFLDYLKYF